MAVDENSSALAEKVETLVVSEPNRENQEVGEDGVSLAERSLLQKVIRKGLVENKNDIEVQRKDPKSPLYSVKSFEALNLKPALLKGVYGKLGSPRYSIKSYIRHSRLFKRGYPINSRVHQFS